MKISYIAVLIMLLLPASLLAQETLPNISVNNANNKIIVSWRNEYKKPVTVLNIQRSYDSLKNFTTIGSVFNPQNLENGYADATPPYTRMYYRVFVAFEGGSYIYTEARRPVPDTNTAVYAGVKYPWMVDPNSPDNPFGIVLVPGKSEDNFPSRWIYTAKDNNVIVHLPEAGKRKYSVKFFDNLERLIFDLDNLKDEYLIIEKVNFLRSGWYRFELFDAGKLVEKNDFFIAKDGKGSNEPVKRPGNR